MNEARADYAKLLESFRELEADRNRLDWEIEAPKEVEFPDALELKNEVRKKYPKSEIKASEIEVILEFLEGGNDDDYLPNKEVRSLPATAPIENLSLSVRAYGCLKRAQINTLAELLTYTPQSLLKIEKLGKTSVSEIENSLQRFGLALASEEKNES